MYGWSFSAISWAASRGCSFCGAARVVDDLGGQDWHEANRMLQSTMSPPLLWSMTGASMIVPASNSSCIECHLRSRPARRSERTTWPSGDSGWSTYTRTTSPMLKLRAATRRGGRRARGC